MKNEGMMSEMLNENREDEAKTELEKLQEENRRLSAENERLKELSLKERMYDKIHVSVRTMDIFIGAMCVLFLVVVVMGIIN